MKKDGEKSTSIEQVSQQAPQRETVGGAPATGPTEQKPQERPKAQAPVAAKPERTKASPQPSAQEPKTAKPEKHFPAELSVNFTELMLQCERQSPLTKFLPRVFVFFLQPLLGALPHQTKKDLEGAVQSRLFFSAEGATALNILANMILYPLICIVAAVALVGVDIAFSQKINIYVLVGVLLGFLEGFFRLREGIFHGQPAERGGFRAALYGAPLIYVLKPLIARHAGIVRGLPIPVDGFYEKGFDEKMERERRYGNVYTVADWGNAYFLRVEFPRRVPDIGHPVRSDLPNEMPDYDYDLILKDGHFIVKGRCVDERVRKISSSVGAFPPEFTTVIPLQESIEGFSHRFENKILEVLLLKQKKHGEQERSDLQR